MSGSKLITEVVAARAPRCGAPHQRRQIQPGALAREPRASSDSTWSTAGSRARARAFQLPTTRSIVGVRGACRRTAAMPGAPSAGHRSARDAAAESVCGAAGCRRRTNGRAMADADRSTASAAATSVTLSLVVDVKRTHDVSR